MADLAAIEADRNAALAALAAAVPYNRRLGVVFDRLGDELTARLPFRPDLVGNPFLPAIHGGVIGSFLEITALTHLAWDQAIAAMEAGAADRPAPIPKTIDITIDFLRPGRPRDSFARARVQRAGRRIVHLHVEAWQEARDRPIALLRGNFLLPQG